jgi:hypothetical protein
MNIWHQHILNMVKYIMLSNEVKMIRFSKNNGQLEYLYHNRIHRNNGAAFHYYSSVFGTEYSAYYYYGVYIKTKGKCSNII